MDDKTLLLAKAKQKKQDVDREHSRQQLEGFIAELSSVISRGIQIEGLSELGDMADAVERYGQRTSELISEIRDVTRTIPDLSQLTLPDSIEIHSVTDDTLIKTLERIGDNGELLQKFESLDQTLVLLADVVKPTPYPRPEQQEKEEYLPVRIVLGQDNALRWLENWPVPTFMGNSSSSSSSSTTVWGINDKDDTGTYVYYGFETADGIWKILRKTTATNAFRYATGASGYSAAWSARAGQTYDIYGTVF